MSGIAYHDGRLGDPVAIRVAGGDAGLLRGDGLFETLLCRDGRPVDPEAHLDRLLDGLGFVEIEIPESRSELAGVIEAVAAEAPRPFARLRVTITRGPEEGSPTRLITAGPCQRPTARQLDRGVAVIVSRLGVWREDPMRRIKSTSYQRSVLASREATAAGAWEALMVNAERRLAEGARSNVLVRFEDRVVTPPESEGCLGGTVRRRLLESAAIEEEAVPVDRLAAADEIMLASSIVGVLPVRRVGDRDYAPGPAARTLREHWEREWLVSS